jgi:hypothetical protein
MRSRRAPGRRGTTNGFRGKLTYANVMATVAVFIALGGGAIAASNLAKNSVGTKQLRNNAVTGAKVKNGSLTGADVDAATLGKVPSAALADSAAHAGSADSAANANHATSADNANTLGGKSASQFAPSAIEDWHEIGAAGEPAFENSWKNIGGEPNLNQGVFSTAAFRRDPDGLVHLKGVVTSGSISSTNAIFYLPSGFRPEQAGIFSAATSDGSPKIGWVYIGAAGSPYAGAVLPFTGGNTFFSLDGITFLCSPSGQNGCP